MVQRIWNSITLPDTGGYLPDATGWTDAIFQTRKSVSCQVTLQPADVNDPTLSIDGLIQATNDPAGITGWFDLDGELWIGGPQGRTQVASQPSLGPFSTDVWPDFQRLRIRGFPSRTVTGVRIVASAV